MAGGRRMLKAEHGIDLCDSTPCLNIESDENFRSMSVFYKSLRQVIEITCFKLSNHSIVFKTKELEDQGDRTFIICWSDVARLMRAKKIKVNSFCGEWME